MTRWLTPPTGQPDGCARSPELLSAHEVQQYLLHLVRERHPARASVNQYGCAFRFLYGTVLGLNGQAFQIPLAPQLQRPPQILSRAEVAALLSCAHDLRAHVLLSCACVSSRACFLMGLTNSSGFSARHCRSA
ncbi:MAG: phage integrase N-terminal SAM-like domain-containing protein [Rhizobacter sp.]|nr:phage integrase N-terminal SAM-like domain-containing protein [Rhizobacter sp.]